jgi:hypothetical protein
MERAMTHALRAADEPQLKYSDGIAAARTMIAVAGNAVAEYRAQRSDEGESGLRDQPQRKGELSDVFDGSERTVAVVIQRPYMRHVYVRS